ncbi:hypothetical protein Plim_1780 [Planctopirus limnophila DSM 3776]|uniref:Tetratricopeptide repeat protein n=1 Tax=Planctopirus limnophila (strain ATCC 43296 / DSM 3776 / IFAM 1008 / Mu 290) TaxID=521674 RepID=D5SXP3_PLAL2|nr:hypothetical protein [Planctopirus limnophila]ADG67610.1 hypothetical protein Plim_1780 [Planctopirus limnophila DSM 3776]
MSHSETLQSRADTLQAFALNHGVSPEAYLAWKEVAQLREEIGDHDGLLYAKIRWGMTCSFSGHGAESLPLLAWCLSQCETDAKMMQRYRSHLLTFFRNVAGGVADYDTLSLHQIEQLIKRLQQHMTSGHSGQREIAFIRFTLASHTGHIKRAEEAYREFIDSPRDLYSRCQACETDGVIQYLLFKQNWEEAIAQAQPALKGLATCAEVPHRTIAYVLQPHALLGRYEEADALQKRGYRLIRNNPRFLRHQALHIAYLRHRGRFVAALNMIERHFRSADETLIPLSQLYFFVAMRKVLQEVAFQKSRVKLSLGVDLPGLQSDGYQEIAPLLGWLNSRIESRFTSFDRRNETSYISQLMPKDFIY